jgi:hypothetical protein
LLLFFCASASFVNSLVRCRYVSSMFMTQKYANTLHQLYIFKNGMFSLGFALC